MEVVAVTGKSFADFVLDEMVNLKQVDVLVLGFDVCSELDYGKEIKSKQGIFYDLSILSKDLECVVLAGCVTNLYGIKRKSVIAVDNGDIIGVSDMNNVPTSESYTPGYGYKVYHTTKGNIGVVVDMDVFFSDSVQTVSKAGGSFVINIADTKKPENHLQMARSQAYLHGIDVVVVSDSSVEYLSEKHQNSDSVKKQGLWLKFTPQVAYSDMLQKRRGNFSING